MFNFSPAKEPTFYYIGTSTTKSSIMNVFPKWAEYLGIGGTPFIGIDCKVHDDPKVYRKIVSFLKKDTNSLGALVTTHKLDLYEAAKDLFDNVGHYTELLGEVSCISKRDGVLWGHAKDPITSGLALEAFIPEDHWIKNDGEICIIGAGGASLALTTYLIENYKGQNMPSKVYVANRSTPRLRNMEKLHKKMATKIDFEYIHCPSPEDNDRIVNKLKPGSLVINGTGLGKDIPGSPLTDSVEFPVNGYAWDYNYRGELKFLQQARSQTKEKNLHVEDGWIYFIHGWTRVIAEVFHIKIPTSGSKFNDISKIAEKAR
ncbi:MAG: shikimate dehydrogenase [Candidatus Lokiarchaeota archaeon]|nr:shikimate dehydrogenase [Candidatus Lokiarchaeota archaeon]MBD3340966.1 shikimate dehydrogenase [Candidatus Lokiarchaeota archaeon]